MDKELFNIYVQVSKQKKVSKKLKTPKKNKALVDFLQQDFFYKIQKLETSLFISKPNMDGKSNIT